MRNHATKCEHTDGPRHDCEYVEWRNGLIPIAERSTDKTIGPEPVRGETRRAWRKRWDAMFHREMTRLANDPFTSARFRVSAPAKVAA